MLKQSTLHCSYKVHWTVLLQSTQVNYYKVHTNFNAKYTALLLQSTQESYHKVHRNVIAKYTAL